MTKTDCGDNNVMSFRMRSWRTFGLMEMLIINIKTTQGSFAAMLVMIFFWALKSPAFVMSMENISALTLLTCVMYVLP